MAHRTDSSRILPTLSLLIGLLFLLPAEASTFFCNQKDVTVQWGKDGTFKIDGNDFSRGNFTVIDPGDPALIEFDRLEVLDGLDASFELSGLRPGTTTIQVRWEFTDKSDDGICTATVEVTDLPYSYQAARSDILDYISSLNLDRSTSAAFMPFRPLCPGTTIRSAITEVVDLELSGDAWFSYIDFNVDLRYGRYGQYVMIDGQTGTMTTEDVEGYPIIDGIPFASLFDAEIPEQEVIFGTRPSVVEEPDGSLITDEVTPTPKTDVCAVLVSGTAEKQVQLDAFAQDVEFVKGNLMRERLGPQLAETDIAVMNNASFGEIRAKLEGFRGKYSKVYFYYSGHGTERYMVTNDTVGNRMWYVDLVRALEQTEADDICVILDACHSGGAVPTFRNSETLQSRNVTLLTSCSADTSSWTRYIVVNNDTVRTGEYTWAWAKCFGDPRADSDNDNRVTIKEAHSWALEQNPELDVGGTLRGRMDPQCWVHRAPETTEQVTRPLDTRITIDQGTENPLPAGSELRIDVNFETDDTETVDTNVYYVSSKIQWDMRLVPDPGGYSIGIAFDYDFAEEEFTGEGEPGVVWRADTTELWRRFLPTIPDTVRKIVLADDLTHFGQFAVAEVRSQPASSTAETAGWQGFALDRSHPNPFTTATQIDYHLPHPGRVFLRVVDRSGRTVTRIDAGVEQRGTHRIRWDGTSRDGRPLASGTYLLHLEVGSPTEGTIHATTEVILIR